MPVIESGPHLLMPQGVYSPIKALIRVIKGLLKPNMDLVRTSI